ncbi:MAG: RsmE family RNA methyltransferase [Psychrobacter sp.]|nr:RsmE family RNA methyltransferase [Psychrobacter sp.]
MNYLLLPAPDSVLPPEGQALSSNQAYHGAVIRERAQVDHVINILGAKAGDRLKVAQRHGNLGSALIDNITAEAIYLSDIQLSLAPPAKLGLTVILALPRPKVLRRLVMDMTALGVNHIILLNSYRSQKSYWQSPMLARLNEFVDEGLQQAGDTVAPQISLKKRFKPFVEEELASYLPNRWPIGLGSGGIVAHPYAAASLGGYLDELKGGSENQSLPSLICIGAEGGWIDYEIDLFQAHGCHPVSIGRRILRTEAAVNALLGHWLLANH